MPMDFITQNILLISIVVVSAAGLIWPLFAKGGGERVNPAQATLLINREDAVVVDVREAGEFSAGHLPDARNLPLDKFSERMGELDKVKDKPVILCCATGLRAGKAAGQLKDAGFGRVLNLDGGIDAWVAAGYPVKKGNRNK